MTALLGGALLAAAAALYVLEPVLSGRAATRYAGRDTHDESAARRRVALAALRDLEYDRATGKVVGDDYDALKNELSREAIRALDARPGSALAAEAELVSRELEDEIASIRRALRQGLQCEGCQRLNDAGARYCGGCGKPLSTGSSSAGSGAQDGSGT